MTGISALFFWMILLFITVLGNARELHAHEIGLIISGGSFALAAAAALLSKVQRLSRHSVLAAGATLSLLPLIAGSSVREGTVLLDLYFVLLVAIPAFAAAWSGWWQAGFALVSSIAAVSLWGGNGDWSSLQSMFLTIVASTLSIFVVSYQRQDSALDPRQPEPSVKLDDSLAQAAELREMGWNVFFLQAALLLVLLFLDIAVYGAAEKQAVLCKVYGLIILVLGGLLSSITDRRRTVQVIAVSTVLVGAMLSLARVSYGLQLNLYFALPLLYLSLLVVSLPWSRVNQIMVIWALLMADVFVRFLGASGIGGYTAESLGNSIQVYRGELAVEFIGALVAILAVALRYRQRALSTAHRPMYGAQAVTADTTIFSGMSSCRENIADARQQQLAFWQFVLGICSCLTSSRLLAELSAELWYVNLLSWVVFLLLWGCLLHATLRKFPEHQVWALGVLVQLILVLWPSVLLIVVDDSGGLWLFWPIAVLLGLGAVPWRRREFATLMMVVVIVGVEIVRHEALGAAGLVSFLLIALLAALFNLFTIRRVIQRTILEMLGRDLEGAKDETAVLRTFTEYLVALMHGHGGIVITSRGTVEAQPPFTELRLSADQILNGSVILRELAPNQRRESCRLMRWTKPHALLKNLGAEQRTMLGVLVELQGDYLPELEGLEIQSGSARTGPSRCLIMLRGRFFPPWQISEIKTLQYALEIVRPRLDLLFTRHESLQQQQQDERKLAEREYELGALVHDINNTVQDLTLLCETILESDPDDTQPAENGSPHSLRDQMRRIEGVARSIATIVSDAKRKRELERMDDLRPRELVEVGEIVEEIVEFARLRAERKRIAVSPFGAPQEKLWVKVSVREHLETILRNLLGNAVTYSESGTQIDVNVRFDSDHVWIDVRDSGPGLTVEECESIFEIGFRGTRGSDVRGGLGLGLAVSRRVAQSAGGSLEVFSEGLGHGATFTVCLPRHSAPPGGASRAWALLVDDEPAILDFYTKLARVTNLVPYPAMSVREALSLIEQHGEPGLVITDIHLSGSDGLLLVGELRKMFGKALPILVISGLHDVALGERARNAGATDFVQKPVSRRALFARIQSLLP